MGSRYRYTLVALALWTLTCGQQERFTTTVVPKDAQYVLTFRGYVTDDEQELVGRIYTFTRELSHVDTADGLPVYAFYSNDERFLFYEDEDGALHQLTTVNLSDRILPFGLRTSKPALIRFWETLLRTDDGVGTEWEVTVDTTITATDSAGNPVTVRYYYGAKARFEGWGRAAIPESQTYEDVLDVFWHDVDNYIVNETANDTLFVRRGTAHTYFNPELGVVKYISDYVLKDRKHDYVSRHGTWELIKKEVRPAS